LSGKEELDDGNMAVEGGCHKRCIAFPDLSWSSCGVEILGLLSRVSFFCWVIKSILSKELELSRPELIKILEDTALLNSESLAWKEGLPPNQQYQSYATPKLSHRDTPMFPTRLHISKIYNMVQSGSATIVPAYTYSQYFAGVWGFSI
jgi:hypothetical protein